MEIDTTLDPSRLRQPRPSKKVTSKLTDVVALLQPGPLTSGEWEAAAKSKLKISRRSFFRLRAEAETGNAIELVKDKYHLTSQSAQVPQVPNAVGTNDENGAKPSATLL